MKQSQKDRIEAIEALRGMLSPGDTVYCILRHVSSSGMSRRISLVIQQNGIVRNIDSLASKAIGLRESDSGGLIVGGCGMDMGFHLVYTLGSVMFRGGFGVEGTTKNGRRVRPKSKRSASAHVGKGVNFWGRNGDRSGWDNDGGYALRSTWL